MRLGVIQQQLMKNIRKFSTTGPMKNADTGVAPNTTGNRLRKIDLAKDMDSLPKAQQMYIKKMIEKNNERYAKEKKLRTHYRISAGILFSVVFSIYFYSMYAVKQEKFLDDFDVPAPPDPAIRDFKR